MQLRSFCQRIWVYALLLSLCVAPLSQAAPSKQYVNRETDLIFADAAQSPNGGTFTLSSLASGAGQYSARLDRGTASHAWCYRWQLTFQLTGTPNIVQQIVELWFASSDGINTDGELGSTTAALASDKRNNLLLLGNVLVDQTTTNTNMTGSGWFCHPSRYLQFGVWNGSTLPFKTDTTVHKLKITPFSLENQ